jgi:uncharacterized protein (TIGR03083 family)
MDLSLELGRHLDGIREALDAFATHTITAGLAAPVPTTPDWDVRHLVAHQGLVHRWATAVVRGEDIDDDTVEREGLQAVDPLAWLRAGGEQLIAAIEAAPDDLDALVFLVDAPPAKQFWARRQCHETTIHAVDALSAALGRHPRAEDTWISREVALDGIDELLTGFMPRPRSRLRSDEPTAIAVVPDDADRRWTVTVTQRPPTTVREASPDDADVVICGSAVALYLTLWNRSDELDGAALDLWAEGSRVTWA